MEGTSSTSSAPAQPDPHWSEALVIDEGDGSAHVVFRHEGRIDHDTVRALLSRAEAATLALGDPLPLRKRLFNVLVEGLENAHRHTDREHHDSAFAVLLDAGHGYRLIIGNAAPQAAAALVAHRVSILNEMDEPSLKEHFLRMLANDGRTGGGGAGLGLITMARKSERPMQVRTLRKDERTAYLALELRMGRER